MHFAPDAPMHVRYQVAHEFLSPEIGWEVVTISRLVNAFFRWEFNSCETPRPRRRGAPDRLRERLTRRRADEPPLLLPVGDGGPRQVVCLLRRDGTRACAIDQDQRAYFDIGDREDLTYQDKLARVPPARRRLLPGRRVRGVLRDVASDARRLVVEYFAEPGVRRRCSSRTVQRDFPAHEHEAMVARHRGLVDAWVADQG